MNVRFIKNCEDCPLLSAGTVCNYPGVKRWRGVVTVTSRADKTRPLPDCPLRGNDLTLALREVEEPGS